MKKILLFLILTMLSSCKETPSQTQTSSSPSKIIAHVYWQTQNIQGIKIEMVQTGDTLLTDSNGLAEFSVPAGQYTVRAYGIQGPGPKLRTIDSNVVAQSGQTTKIDILDCLGCF